jgi:hypothetical protein
MIYLGILIGVFLGVLLSYALVHADSINAEITASDTADAERFVFIADNLLRAVYLKDQGEWTIISLDGRLLGHGVSLTKAVDLAMETVAHAMKVANNG